MTTSVFPIDALILQQMRRRRQPSVDGDILESLVLAPDEVTIAAGSRRSRGRTIVEPA